MLIPCGYIPAEPFYRNASFASIKWHEKNFRSLGIWCIAHIYFIVGQTVGHAFHIHYFCSPPPPHSLLRPLHYFLRFSSLPPFNTLQMNKMILIVRKYSISVLGV